jgi:hypothetical protein
VKAEEFRENILCPEEPWTVSDVSVDDGEIHIRLTYTMGAHVRCPECSVPYRTAAKMVGRSIAYMKYRKERLRTLFSYSRTFIFKFVRISCFQSSSGFSATVL